MGWDSTGVIYVPGRDRVARRTSSGNWRTQTEGTVLSPPAGDGSCHIPSPVLGHMMWGHPTYPGGHVCQVAAQTPFPATASPAIRWEPKCFSQSPREHPLLSTQGLIRLKLAVFPSTKQVISSEEGTRRSVKRKGAPLIKYLPPQPQQAPPEKF